MALVILGAVDQMHNVVDLAIDKGAQQLRLGAVAKRLRELLEQVGKGTPNLLDAFDVIGAGAGTTRILDFFLASRHLCESGWQFAPRIPEIDLECQSVGMRKA